MRTIKKVASHIFIDGFGGMTQGLFATLIIGTMIQQIGLLIGGSTGNVIYLLGKAAAASQFFLLSEKTQSDRGFRRGIFRDFLCAFGIYGGL